ncbi:fructose bisphosphate aldolase [Propionimicrobium sp. PCR01-08-3]|uniref:fructose bisphosphate aldolase n=1 Tax=Propionimicrobium sp. PCR01-08-3 TaxID=3052086 RepID=UPI00255CC70E|nr:fructose bisphosphate aldolase [Propionimicrobium sp. PCR01-08-3]WIY82504.1 fructose bisphosphate aldolase [Propionimicrobium sp. PCR01-08-3]
MNTQQVERMGAGHGFIAALDQSGGSTPKALRLYGIDEDKYSGEDEMFDLVHAMRERIVTSPAFGGDHILGAILFEKTMDRQFAGQPAADYLWETKHVVPILKIDKGLAEQADGVQLMKPNPGLADLLVRAKAAHIFGTKMRSVIGSANPAGIAQNVAQQFETAHQIAEAGLVPIIEPEVTISAPDKEQSEQILLDEITKRLDAESFPLPVMFKLSIPTVDDFYAPLIANPAVLRVVALSGGYSRDEANERLTRNHGLIASFSRALTEGLSVSQNDDEFNATLSASIDSIYQASLT